MSAASAGNGDFEAARSWHLATNWDEETIVSFEFALMQSTEAFARFVLSTAHLVGNRELSYNEVVILHVVRMQERAKDASTIAKLINRDDLPNVLYNLRKLVALALVEKVKIGSGTYFQVTETGRRETDRYAEVRRQVLLDNINALENLTEQLDAANRALQVMTGLYDAALRDTQILNPATLFGDEQLAGTPKPPRARARRSSGKA